MDIGKKIIEIRKNNNLTQEELAEKLNVTRQTVSNWETLKCYPDIETIILISQKFNITLDNLLNENINMVKDIDKKVRNNKKLKVIIIVFIVISIILGVLFYYKTKQLQKSVELNNKIIEVPDGYSFYAMKKEKLININKDDISYIDIYVVNDKMDKEIISKPLVYNAKVAVLKDETGKSVDNINNAKLLLIAIPNEVLNVLNILEINDNSFLINESNDKGYSSINIILKDYILNYYK